MELTHGREDDEVLGVALRAVDARQRVALLFFVDPALETRLVHPAARAAAPARLQPRRRAVFLVRGETYPTVPPAEKKRNKINSAPN